jgi:serine/threonine protein kinase/TolB-like protein/Tfp pilus assembly protein PilF
MNQEQWQKVTEIYDAALDREPDELVSFLDEACVGDRELRREVETLLAAAANAGSFMQREAIGAVAEMFVGEDKHLPIGECLSHFKIVSRIGAGGMGEVYLAEDLHLKRPVALKVLPDDIADNKEYLRRFEQEALAVSALNHPNILTIYEIVEANGTRFIASEYVKGETLRRTIHNLSVAETLDIAVQIAAALDAAHAAGIVHRDIKPENIMRRDDGLIKVLDFGLAKLIKQPSENSEAATRALVKTKSGLIMGTTAYMSPEQARGKTVDARTDIFSFGVVLYEMLAGKMPFAGDSPGDLIAAILKTEPAPLARFDVPKDLERIVNKALRKNADERYQHVKDLLIDLRDFKQDLEFEAKLERRNFDVSTAGALSESAVPTEKFTFRQKSAEPKIKNADAKTLILEAGSTAETEPAGKTRNFYKRRNLLVLAALTAFAALGVAGYFAYFAARPPITSVAVLPFQNQSGDANLDYLSDGLSESVIDRLSQLPQLKVIARGSSFKYRGADVDFQKAANDLGVGAIVTGRVAPRADGVTIRVEMIDAGENKQLWGETFSRQTSDAQILQTEIAREIADNLRLRLSGAQTRQLAKTGTTNPQAYELELKGRYYWRKGGTENWKKAIEYYEQSIAADPNYALAYSRLSGSYKSLVGNSLLDPQEFTPKAEAAAHKALELDENLADAHYAFANLKTDAWQWREAESAFKRSVELNPNLAGARNAYSAYLSLMGRHDEAIQEIKRAREIDPLSLIVSANVGYRLVFARRYDEAIVELQKTLAIEPKYGLAHIFNGYAYAAKGMFAEAVAAYQAGIKLGADSPSVQISLGAALARAGERARAQAILRRLQTGKDYVSPGESAILHAALGER